MQLFNSSSQVQNLVNGTQQSKITHWGVGALFFLNYIWAKVAKLLYVDKYVFDLVFLPFVQAVQEVKESNYSLLFAFAALFSVFSMLYTKSDSQQ